MSGGFDYQGYESHCREQGPQAVKYGIGYFFPQGLKGLGTKGTPIAVLFHAL
jgi:hypothetical protein